MGKFVISLDFELLWGVRDKKDPFSYGENILGVWTMLPKMLEMFEEYKINTTFATVGFLFASTKEELIEFCPMSKPKYANKNLSPYNGHFDLMKENEELDKYHFAPKLIDLILQFPNHEISSHTFSHYYCQEEGTTKSDFENDIQAAIKIAISKGISLKSFVFPRNQFNHEYLDILLENGITVYRGNEKSGLYNKLESSNNNNNHFYYRIELYFSNKKQRLLRLLDSYINISGHNCFELDKIFKDGLYNIPSSRFLRPYSSTLQLFDKLKVRRIKKSMTYAAKNNLGYHLWWHPHNFGINQEKNFILLKNILEHYQELNKEYNFESSTMQSFIYNKS